MKKHYDNRMIVDLIPSGSSPGKLYGTVKVRQSNFPLRPVVSMVNTPEYAFRDGTGQDFLNLTRSVNLKIYAG